MQCNIDEMAITKCYETLNQVVKSMLSFVQLDSVRVSASAEETTIHDQTYAFIPAKEKLHAENEKV